MSLMYSARINGQEPYLGRQTPSPAHAEHLYDQAARAAPTDVLSAGLAAMFHSDKTPPFSQRASHTFGNSDPGQRDGMLKSLIRGMGPAVLSSLAGQIGQGGGLAGVFGQLLNGSQVSNALPTITADQASQITPDQVEVIARHAEQATPASSTRSATTTRSSPRS